MNDVVEVVKDGEGVAPFDDQIDFFFKIHQKINSKSEEISKSYNANLVMTFDDLEELHLKTIQSINSLSPAHGHISVRIAVSHDEGESEKFNSFDDFAGHNKTGPKPTSDIQMEYKFSLSNLETGDYENYVVACAVRSRLADLLQIEREAGGIIPPNILSQILTTTAQIKVKYIDYVKARHFTAMFDEWIEGCEKTVESKPILLAKSISRFIPMIGKTAVLILMAYFTVTSFDESSYELDFLAKFGVIYASLFYLIAMFSSSLLTKVETSIDSYLPVSYLNISKGDQKLIGQFNERNKKNFLKSVLGIAGVVALGILSSASYDLIKNILN